MPVVTSRAVVVVALLAITLSPSLAADVGTPISDQLAVAPETPATGSGPGLGQEAKIVSPDPQESAFFGSNVALEDNTLAVLSPSREDRWGTEGGVFLYELGQHGWVHEQSLFPPQDREFGWSLAFDGDTLAVGHASEWDDGVMWAGAVYFYNQTPDGWQLKQTITGLDVVDPSEGCCDGVNASRAYQLGRSIALDGDTAIVQAFGAYHENPGRAHVFTKVNGTWTETQVVEKSRTASDDGGLAIDGDQALVGNLGHSKAYVYTDTPNGWVETDALPNPDSDGGDKFTWAVDLDGDRAIVGEFWDHQAHVFVRTPVGWELETTFTGPAGTSPSFGRHVAIEDDLALVAAPEEEMLAWRARGPAGSEGIGNDAGAVYVYRRAGDSSALDSNWTYEGRITARDAGSRDWFGSDVDIENGIAAVGALQDNHGNESRAEFLGLEDTYGEGNQGSAYLFSADSDADGVANRSEGWRGTEQADVDTDGDGVDDGTEVTCGWNPTDPSSPTQVGGVSAMVDGPAVPFDEHRWWVCGVLGS